MRSLCRTSVRRSLSLSSSSSSPVEQRQRQARPRSRSLSSNSGDSSINTPVDRRSQRRTASTLHGASGRLFTQTEDRVIIRSLRRKLLVNDGKRLNRIERQLLRAMDHRGRGEDGWVSTTAFEDALMTDGKASDGGEPVTRDESLWLSEKLESRNRKKVSCFRIRSLLTGGDDEGLGVGSGKSRRYHDDNRVHRSRHSRKWAVRRGTVGQWLQDVASPMVSINLSKGHTEMLPLFSWLSATFVGVVGASSAFYFLLAGHAQTRLRAWARTRCMSLQLIPATLTRVQCLTEGHGGKSIQARPQSSMFVQHTMLRKKSHAALENVFPDRYMYG